MCRPEKAGVSGSTPSLATITFNLPSTSLPFLISYLTAIGEAKHHITMAPN